MYPITHSPIHSSAERSHRQSTSVLRDSDVLIDFTNHEVSQNGLTTKTEPADFEPQKCKNLDWFKGLSPVLVYQLGYNFWVERQSKQLKWQTLTAPEK